MSKAVDGTKGRKRPTVKGRAKIGTVTHVKVDGRVMKAAREALREGEKLKIVDGETVRTVYK